MDWGCMSLDSRERRSAWRARICDRSWSAGSATYQLYHGITDTNLTLLPLPNEFFFGVFLKHRTTLSYRTLDPSAGNQNIRGVLRSEERRVGKVERIRVGLS